MARRPTPMTDGSLENEPALRHGRSMVYLADCLDVLRRQESGHCKAIYIDPPFFTQKTQVIDSRRKSGSPRFSDSWRSREDYLSWLRERLAEMTRVLAEDGLLFVQCDWHASHSIKLTLDELVGPENFRNEIIWQRSVTAGRSPAPRTKRLSNVTDSIFVYSKNPATALRKVQLSLRIPCEGQKPPPGFHRDPKSGRFFKTSPLGNYSQASLAKFTAEGRIHTTRTGRKRLIYWVETVRERGQLYLLDHRELGNLWTDIPSMMHVSKSEKIAYPTQKPLELIRRLLGLCVSPGDLVGDFFLGSGTTWLAAQSLGCDFIGADLSPAAIAAIRQRLANGGAATAAA